MTTRKDIENALMRGADTLRDTIDAANYKDYVLPIMFVKYLSDSYEDALDKLKKQYSGIRLERQKRYLPFTVAEDCSFQSLYKQRFADNIGQLINAAMRQIEADNNQQLAGVLSAVDYNSENALGTREHKNAILRDLLEDFEPLNLRPSMIEVKEGQVPADVIGDAYEYMIGQFASMAGKKAGSFYTPAAVSEIMARIVNVQPGERVYDPTCGSGSLLIKAAKKQNSKEVSIFGQEVNGSSVAMAKMNMYIHEIRDAMIGWGDTLANPVFLDSDGNLLLFDAIVANMPFSLRLVSLKKPPATFLFTGAKSSASMMTMPFQSPKYRYFILAPCHTPMTINVITLAMQPGSTLLICAPNLGFSHLPKFRKRFEIESG